MSHEDTEDSQSKNPRTPSNDGDDTTGEDCKMMNKWQSLRPDVVKSSIFSNSAAFQLNYIPERILHRGRQIDRLHSVLLDLKRGVFSTNILGLGDMATGKTLVFRDITRQLPREQSIYINCIHTNTVRRILHMILQDLGCPTKWGFGNDYYWGLVKEYAARQPFIILTLDEVDQFIEHRESGFSDFFYTISREVSNIVTFMLTNRLNFESTFQAALDPRARDTFRFERLEFPNYTEDELREILKDRCQVGLRKDCYDEDTIRHIAALSYRNGGARDLIDITRKSGEICEAEGAAKVTPIHIEKALKLVNHERGLDIIQRLNPVKKELLILVYKQKPTMSMLYKEYRERLAEKYEVSPCYSMFLSFVNDLRTLTLIQGETRGRGKGKGVETPLVVPPLSVEILERTIRMIQRDSSDENVTERNNTQLGTSNKHPTHSRQQPNTSHPVRHDTLSTKDPL